MQALTTAIGNYGVTRQFKEAGAHGDRLTLEFVEIDPILAAVRRMARGVEFDICEMPITTYLCARAAGKPFTAIPVFLTRNFHHWALFYNAGSGIRDAGDLEGRTVGVNRGYTVTTGLWARGILQTEHGVDLDKVHWAATDEEHVAEFQAPANVDYRFRGEQMADLLLSGRVDAAIGDIRSDAPEIRPLIADAREAGFAYYRKTGIYPVNHTVVVRDSVLEAEPQVAAELFLALNASKAAYLAHLEAGENLAPADQVAITLGNGVGGDPYPNGVEPNRKALEALVRFAFDQHITPVQFGVEELFAPATLDLA